MTSEFQGLNTEIIYICKCGCELPKSGIYRSRTGHSTRILCREHKQPVTGRKKQCEDCLEWYMLKPTGPGGIRCPDCAAEAMAKRRRESFSPPQKPRVPAPKWSVDKRGDYCQSLPDCETRECPGCPDFTGWWDPEKWWVPGVRL